MTHLQIDFLGGAGTVTGSRFLIRALGHTLLIDCGLFQGLKALRLQNWEPLPFPAAEIEAVLLTHGHMDHSGYLPCLMRQGFKGPVYCSEPSQEVAAIILRDSGKIQEEEAEKANQKGYSRHAPARPLYTAREAEKALGHFRTVNRGEWLVLFPDAGIRARWHYNGHILGACFIELEIAGKTVIVSGDIGRHDDWLLYPPHKPQQADLLLMESTYGNRLHPDEDVLARLEKLAHETLSQGGSLLIPGFAVERTQTLLWLLLQLQSQNRLPKVPILLDSPMGSAVLAIFERFNEWHKLSKSECQELTQHVHVVEHARETQKWASRKQPKLVLAGSGMLTGGRILSYLLYELANPLSTVLLTGYQAEGTRGRDLLEGIPSLKIQGNHYPVKARIEQLESLSAHADQNGLIDWLSDLKKVPQELFIVHGEPEAAAGLQARLLTDKRWPSRVAQAGESFELEL
ncbi:MBL fold metallo-hydrolase [bacterium (Candidatus Blackallbacteria) CG17_big_fil_post_rev_8_21_14_2_50_48_46]|uniref:MBL fold metallo-hydrolase n=1 Tax=bacterium (Candidatus Blackallbacteria) CG17_big_fil_post_rev_8_21_14_2_50_48_46 TaxID=2014261 RepID=A0A2M7FXL4_9BACT|nr:MAG: MBL fold metallo-hydrolase [bacterium (Candidatus Blackallbacteria) CG18_big_fil_WC_8_21_14_2_50_49_26]PIW13991.1 MAG: MBL fold metallo-hydrolase [bacterium (Candidatus Blackallbacteria) CG17_big_fil_post_rev_8_21_14_2_50_48_46]PIW46842.1 MAG: MBL fold metallo-hydrolase [bacterium (Candidatus Blackallbacteria) CG13_big_fil_rev_8_21_14_2_50_49_14]